MSRYTERFAQLKARNQKAFMPFALLGWPNQDTCLEVIRTLLDNGATALELGMPFRDPVSDGPIIQAAAQEALNNGFRTDHAWDIIRTVRGWDGQIPICLMIYFNMVMARGLDRFFQEAVEAGVDGILIVDLPPEVADKTHSAAQKAGIDLIFILSPLTTPERLAKMTILGSGFLYIVSRLGITGTEERYDADLGNLITMAKAQTDLPLCVGFGISTPEQAHKMLDLGADGVITASCMIQMLQAEGFGDISQTLKAYLHSMQAATQRVDPK